MSLPYPTDPSLPANPSPLFSDVTAARGDQMRANNAQIWANFNSVVASLASSLGLIGDNHNSTYAIRPNGFSLSNAADTEHDITIAAGYCYDSTGVYLLTLASALTKRIDAGWEAGTNKGGLDTGSVAASKQYYLWLIRKDADGTIDALFSLSLTAPTLPAGYTAKRILRGVNTDASANIINGQWVITDVVNDRSPILIVRDEKSANTAGGTFNAGSYATRVLNTIVVNEIAGASLATNKIALPSGLYRLNASVPAFQVALHKAILWDVTNNSLLLVGSSEDSTNGGAYITSKSIIVGYFSLSGPTEIEVRHNCSASQASTGFGIASNLTYNEVYTIAEITKIS